MRELPPRSCREATNSTRTVERESELIAPTSDGTCPLCGGDCGPGQGTWSVDLGALVVLARHVPATVCTQCSAQWLDHRVVRDLHRRSAEALARGATVEILDLAQ